jgi:hypothetical protein
VLLVRAPASAAASPRARPVHLLRPQAARARARPCPRSTLNEGVFSGLSQLLGSRAASVTSPLGRMDHKVDTLVAAPAAVDDALASLSVDGSDRALQVGRWGGLGARAAVPSMQCGLQCPPLAGGCSAGRL